MSTLSNPPLSAAHEAAPAALNVELRCALSGRQLSPDEAYWAPPLITARDLIGTTLRTLTKTPGNLGSVLTAELPNVPYAPEARAELANRRTAEQLKLLALLMLIAAVLIVPIILLVA